MLPGFNLVLKGPKGHQECLDSRECQECQVNQDLKVLQAREDLQEVIHQVDILATHQPLCPMEEMQRWWTQSLEEMLLKRPKTMY